MPKLPICPYCNGVVEKNHPNKKYNNRTYHLNCYTKYCEEEYNNSNLENSDSQKELYDYICKIFNIKEMTSFLNFQLQKIFKENNFTYDGVLYTLKYFYEIKENMPDIKYGIGIVPLIYDEAKQFYIKKSFLREKNGQIIHKNDPIRVKIRQKTQNKKPFVDINKL